MSPSTRRGSSHPLTAGGIALVLAAILLGVGRSVGQTQSPTPSASPSIIAQSPTPIVSPSATASPLSPAAAAGRMRYEQDCAWCHGIQGEGTSRGPDLVGVGAASADFMLRTGRMPIVTEQRQPQPKTPAYNPTQIAQLDQFVASLGPGPPIPSVDPRAGDLGMGADLYQVNCAACHSSTGIGGALTNGLEAPGLGGSTATEIAEAVRLGGQGLRTGHMPKFGPEVLDQHQLDSIVRYVLYLQHPKDPGGAALGHLGPIVEGLVTWAGGLLILVVFIRWIGTRTR